MKRKAIPKKLREEVKARFGGRCGYCGTPSDKLHIDHIVPVAREQWIRGSESNRPENLMPACFSCNNYKHTMSLETFRREIAQQVARAKDKSVNFRIALRYHQIIISETPIMFHFESVALAALRKE